MASNRLIVKDTTACIIKFLGLTESCMTLALSSKEFKKLVYDQFKYLLKDVHLTLLYKSAKQHEAIAKFIIFNASLLEQFKYDEQNQLRLVNDPWLFADGTPTPATVSRLSRLRGEWLFDMYQRYPSIRQPYVLECLSPESKQELESSKPKYQVTLGCMR